MNKIRVTVTVLALAATGVLGVSGIASAERVPTVSQSALKAGCAANGGNSYGNPNAYGCTKNHADGSSDTLECGRQSGCVHIHNDPAIRTGSGRRVGAATTAAR